MLNYIIRRLLLIPVTLFGIMLLNFVIIQFAPGGPVEQVIAQLQGTDVSATARVTNQGAESGSGGGGGSAASSASGNNFSSTSNYRGAQGLDPEVIKQLEGFEFDGAGNGPTLYRAEDHQCFKDVLVVRGKENPQSNFDLLEVVKNVPRAQVEYPADMFGGELGPYQV